MEFRKQYLLHEIDVVWLSSLESSKLYASCMQCNANFESVIVLYFFRILKVCDRQYTKEKKQVGTFSEYSASSNIACMSSVHQFSVFVHHHLPFYTHPQQAAIVNAIFIPIIMSTQHKHETNNLLPTVSII